MSKIDEASPQELCDALLSAQPKSGHDRSSEGLKILRRFVTADGHRLPYDQADIDRTLSAHFGWICTHTARALGDENPEPFALCNRYTDEQGTRWLELKPNVVQAAELAYSRFGKR